MSKFFPRAIPLIRFLKMVRFTNSCWEWTASISGGYGEFRVERKTVKAHRWFVEFINGKLEPKEELDHLCRNTKCVNPEHLEIVNHRENVRRGIGPTAINARKTHCIRGHEFNKENTILRPKENNARRCKRCTKDTANKRIKLKKSLNLQ